MRTFLRYVFTFGALGFLFSCSPLAPRKLDKLFLGTETNFHDHTGFMLYDLEEKKSVYAFNADKYFTPASNTKIFTFYTSLTLLGDSLPALRYVETADSLIFWGTGDPTFLYKNVFDNGRVFNFLKQSGKNLYFSGSNFYTTTFGLGWAWDDYNSAYSAERFSFPVYGNLVAVKTKSNRLDLQPPFFKNSFTTGDVEEEAKVIRKVESNDFKFYPSPKGSFEDDIPFRADADLVSRLLADTLKRAVTTVNKTLAKNARVLYSMPVDSAYRVMMQQSDNFIAEQLLMMSAGVLSDSLQPEIAIRYMKKNALKDLSNEPEWVDGSGLSRYNLFTPHSVVQLWEKIYAKVPRERLFPMLATGGKPGTLRNWYKADKPYVFGKTGSLSNVHCLSGFLVTKRGKTVIFSFMNSDFTVASSEVRKNMQTILNLIYENY
ncbi:D-alanyl-D-alanine carboxypeptidase / D-alanyl-D-alanine-endopeptidase (penicillin-binding protein 4) [Chryseolinea serpens]|uniref:D-alanyl-D-alanine carboxypeptidase / D-alanyl-D-alanine-endopeptidase (Penicillin-binding protein 4) n=1 Tax=Chryseolinea serpens TaxID=947013 RepID=A0A1M5XK14_9BACT|nr:D-alanyl-D-alanine carboxypeptidase [Chryseolinea serpens]SHH99854.1 D-alanyl-D-alanine carboxypeptidase / D-alanyl-D-alanine-endopeptidase (penicillin-binding protein 4) [Chryseolinea serpens]